MKSLLDRLPDRTQLLGFFKTKNGAFAGILLATISIVTVVGISAPRPDKKDVAETSYPVTTMQTTPSSVSPEIALFGRVETPRQSSLKGASTAHVISVDVNEGDLVDAGEVLVQLDSTDADLQLQRSQANLIDAEANIETLKLRIRDDKKVLEQEKSLRDLSVAKVERHKKLRAQTSISEETLNAVLNEASRQAISYQRQQGIVDDAANQLARAESQVLRARTEVKAAKVNLARTTIMAPFAGRVTAINVSPGELVQPGTTVAELYDVTSMEVRAQIPTANLSAIKAILDAGDKLDARLQTPGGMTHAVLTRLSGEVGEGRSSIDGLFDVDADARLELGRSVGIVLKLPAVPNTVLVPVQSLYGHDKIFVVDSDRLKSITVERLGEVTDAEGHLNVVIRSGYIDATVPIVTSQLSNAVTGLKVTREKKSSESEPTEADTAILTAAIN